MMIIITSFLYLLISSKYSNINEVNAPFETKENNFGILHLNIVS